MKLSSNLTYRVVKFKNGKYGYNSFFELQFYNEVYKSWSVLRGAIDLTFIESYCIISGLNFKSIPQIES